MSDFSKLTLKSRHLDGLECRLMTENDLDDAPIFFEVLGWNKDHIVSSIRAGHECLLIHKNNQKIAYAIIASVVDELELLMLVVDPHHRRQGLAETFITGLIDHCQKDFMRLFLELRESNLPALKTYKKVGFKQVGRRKHYYPALEAEAGREDALIMSRELKSQA